MDAFTYDLNGDRTIQESHSGGSTTTRAFIYDREDVAVEYSDDTFSIVFRQYIHGPGIDEPLAIVGDGKLNYTYYLHDGLGSVTGIVDMDGKLQGIYDYAAFGETRRDTVSIENRYRYTSREHVEDNLYYYRARHMRPDLGWFTSTDPLGMVDGTNAIRYVKNEPISGTDYTGYKRCPTYYYKSYGDCMKKCLKTCTIVDFIPSFFLGIGNMSVGMSLGSAASPTFRLTRCPFLAWQLA